VNDEPTPSMRSDREAELESALSKGEMPELPANQPKGLLGGRGLDLYSTDTFEPDLNAGISQEDDLPVQWLALLVAYLLFFPLAYWLLWRSSVFSRRAKVVVSIVWGIGVVAVVVALNLP